MKDQIAINRSKLHNYYQTIKRKKKYEVQIVDYENALNTIDSRLLEGSTLGLARARLQVIISDLAEEHEVVIKKQDIKTESTKEMFMEIPVEITISGDLENVGSFIYGLYTSDTAFGIKELEISKRTRRRTEEMETKMVISGFIYLQGDEAKKNV
jgi:hypothetical protein